MNQLVDLAIREKVDAVVIAGDVYDRAVPPADAVALLDDVLARLVLGAGIRVVLISGNHDSPDRVGFAGRVAEKQGLAMRGALTYLAPVVSMMHSVTHVLLDPSNSAISRLMAAGQPRASMNLLPNDRIPSALRSKVRAVRLLALCQSSVDRNAFIKFHRSLEWTERFAVAAHDATPSGVLAALAEDANRWVAARAAERNSGQ